ncbi:hypothetical protein F4774DRAFT_307842 [Daldinia eschscholtzii]|nr:hypothetical protein F4774DRAFT_307842 [Daldinia eschscholtzii]
MTDSDKLQDAIPVFCTASISKEMLDEFFVQSLGAWELQGADWIGVLVNTLDVGTITKSTRPPVERPASYPFQGWGVEDIVKFAHDHINRSRQGIVPDNLVILDERTMEDKTCLLVTPREGSENEGELLTVRADFRSSLVLLNVKVLAVGGDGHFEATGPDGVIRLG